MLRLVSVLLASTLTLGSVAQAATTTLNFDALRGRNGRTGYVYGPYTESGYTLSADRCSTPQGTCFVTTGTTLSSLDRTGAALVNYLGSAVSTIRQANGAAFLLKDLDIAPNYGNQSGYSQPTVGVQFTFNFADGTRQITDYLLPNTAGQYLTRTNLDFDLAPLSSFSWKPTTNSSGFVQFDNITLNNAVPEPAAWALMIAGFGLVGGAMRRRQTVAFAA